MDVAFVPQGCGKRLCVALVSLAVFASSLSITHAQDKKPDDFKKADNTIPVLPPTKVEGTPLSATAPTQAPTEPMPDIVPPADAVPIASGGIFGSGPATGYNAGDGTTGTIVNVPLISFPGTLNVVPNTVIRDQQALRIDDVLRNIPGANKLGNLQRPDSFTLRGYEVQSRDFRWNGFLDQTYAPRDVANIQRIEVLQGPASILYGGGQPGGVVNILTKRPQADPYNALTFMGGSYGLFRTTVDSTGPIDEDGRFLYRLNAAYETRGSFRDFGYSERTFAAPVLTWVIDRDTSLTFEGSYLYQNQHLDTGLVAANGALNSTPISRSFNEPGDFQRFNDYKTSATLVHRFENDWFAKIGFFANWYDAPSYGTVPILAGNSPSLAPINFGPDTLLRQVQNTSIFSERYYSMIANLAGSLETGLVKHNLVLGTELGLFNSQNFTTQLSDPLAFAVTPFFPFPIPVPSSPISISAPRYGQIPPGTPGTFNSSYDQSRFGFYAQDLMEIGPMFKVLAGARADIVDTHFDRSLNSPFGGFNIGFADTVTNQTYYRWTPRVGLVFEPLPKQFSIYTAFSTSFNPPSGGAFLNANPLQPETGRSVEAGLKWDMFEQRLSLLASAYYTVKNNVTTQDSFFFATQLAEQRSQGFQMSLTGKITEAWSVIANYAYTDSRVFGGEALGIAGGTPFRGVPYNNVNIWSRYNLIDDGQQTLGVAVGLVYVGERVGDLQNTFTLPGYTRWDAGLYYKRGDFNSSLYLENIFDKRYYTSSVDQFTVYPGMPFNVRAMVGFTF